MSTHQVFQGTLNRYFDDRGFGFIKRDDGQPDVFVHVSALKRCGLSDVIEVGDRVEFEIEYGRNGKPAADHLRFLENAPPVTID